MSKTPPPSAHASCETRDMTTGEAAAYRLGQASAPPVPEGWVLVPRLRKYEPAPAIYNLHGRNWVSVETMNDAIRIEVQRAVEARTCQASAPPVPDLQGEIVRLRAEIERLQDAVRDLIDNRNPDGIDAFAIQRAIETLPKDGWKPADVYA